MEDPTVRKHTDVEHVEREIKLGYKALARALILLNYENKKITSIINEYKTKTPIRNDEDRYFDRYYWQDIINLRQKLFDEVESKIPIASQISVERREFEIRDYRRKIRDLFANSFGMSIDQANDRANRLIRDFNDKDIIRRDIERFDSTSYSNQLDSLISRLKDKFENLTKEFRDDEGYAS